MKKIKFLSTAAAGKILGFSADYVRRLCGKGDIKAQKVGHDWIMTEKDIANIKRKRSPNKEITNDSRTIV